MQVDKFYKDHWTEYPLEIQGVLEHLNDLWPEGVKGKNALDGGSGSVNRYLNLIYSGPS